jgi:hypothetical protein
MKLSNHELAFIKPKRQKTVRHNARVIDYSRPATGRISSVSDCQGEVVIRWHGGRETTYNSRALTPEGKGYRLGA